MEKSVELSMCSHLGQQHRLHWCYINIGILTSISQINGKVLTRNIIIFQMSLCH